MRLLRSLTMVMGLGLLAASANAATGPGIEKVREMISQKEKAILSVELVMQVKFSGYGGGDTDTERKAEVVAFVINEEGLAVTALSNIDPGSFYARFSGEEEGYTTRLKSMTYILPGNEEIKAGVVLRDPDLDLCFLKPLEKSDRKFDFVPIDQDPKAELLEEVYAVTRMGRIGRRNISAMSGEIQGIIDKPRLLYITEAEISSARAGSPVFDSAGTLLGMNALYIYPGGQKSLGENDEPFMFVVMPTASIRPIAEQAKGLEPEAAPPAEEAAAPGPPAAIAAPPADQGTN